MELDPEYWQAWNNLGTQTAIAGDIDRAVAMYERVLAARPQHSEVWLNLAHAHVARRDDASAATAYESARQRDPGNRRIYTEQMILFAKRGKWEHARSVLRKALAVFPDEETALRKMYEGMVQRAGD